MSLQNTSDTADPITPKETLLLRIKHVFILV